MRISFAHILRSAMNVAAMNAAALALGFVKDLIVAARFGVQDSTDAYFGAIAMPRLLNALTLTLIGLVVVTIFIEIRDRKGEDDAWRYAARVVGASSLFAALLALASALLAAPLVHVTLPGLGGGPAGGTADLLVLLAPSVALVGITAVLGGLLNANGVFALPAALGVIVNLFVIGAIVFGADQLDVAALAIGTDLGYAACAAIELAVLIRLGLRLRPVLGLRDPDIRRTVRLAIPLVGSVAAEQIGLVAARLFVSFGAPGTLSLYVFIEKLRNAPITLIGQALGIALYPSLAHAASGGEKRALATAVGRGLRWALALAVPIACVFVFRGQAVVRLVYERRSFTAADSEAGGALLAAFAFGLVALAVVEILERAFYALQRTGWPATGSFVRAVILIAAGALLLPRYGALGVAVGFSLAGIAEVSVLGAALAWKIGTRPSAKSMRTPIAVAAAAVTVAAISRLVAQDENGLQLLLDLVGTTAAAAVVYITAITALGSRSIRGEITSLTSVEDRP